MRRGGRRMVGQEVGRVRRRHTTTCGLVGLASVVLAAACSPTAERIVTGAGPPSTAGSVPASTTATTSALSREERWASAPGTAARECVDTDRLWAERAARRPGPAPEDDFLWARSGEFMAWSFGELFASGTPGAPDYDAKISWEPLDPDIAETEALDVTVEHLADPAREPLRLRLGGDGGGASTGDGYFWTSGVPLPAAGRWRLTATAPGHWGCFELSV